MATSYLFYDLETSGLDPRLDRIMQFAAIRTDQNFQTIGEPYDLLVRLEEDTLPSPEALMVTGITPQQTVSDGYSEAEFCKIFIEDICTPETVIVGFNNIRFDDEFIRAILWRNFYDPYEWSYKDGRSRWDMLDVVRMTRALRPDGINWPTVDDKPVNRLELLAKENNLEHTKAHDALSDVEALIGVTKLIADKQPQLFDYLFKMRDKNAVKTLVNLDDRQPFVYSSGRYDSSYQYTTVAVPIAPADYGNTFVYDLRYDPKKWVSRSAQDIQKIIDTPYQDRDENFQKLPVKKLQYNRAPAVAPLGVLEQSDGWDKIALSSSIIKTHLKTLNQHPEFGSLVADILSNRPEHPTSPEAEARIYEGFINDKDKIRCEEVRHASKDSLTELKPKFDDKRLPEMFINYKARNFPSTLGDTERSDYETYRLERLKRQTPDFMSSLQRLMQRNTELSDHQQFVLEELKLWFELVASLDDD